MAAGLAARQKARLEEQFKGGGDLVQLITEKRRELFAGEQRARMTGEKQQQIHIGSVSEYADPIEHMSSVFLFHTRLYSLSRGHPPFERMRFASNYRIPLHIAVKTRGKCRPDPELPSVLHGGAGA